jgi:hypothetical protein
MTEIELPNPKKLSANTTSRQQRDIEKTNGTWFQDYSYIKSTLKANCNPSP